jgi:hypothetical protein
VVSLWKPALLAALAFTTHAWAGLTASTARVDFPNTRLGATSAAQVVTVTNTDSVAHIIFVSPNQHGCFTDDPGCSQLPQFSLEYPFTTTCSVSFPGVLVPAGGTCTVTVSFRPAGPGFRPGSLLAAYVGGGGDGGALVLFEVFGTGVVDAIPTLQPWALVLLLLPIMIAARRSLVSNNDN